MRKSGGWSENFFEPVLSRSGAGAGRRSAPPAGPWEGCTQQQFPQLQFPQLQLLPHPQPQLLPHPQLSLQQHPLERLPVEPHPQQHRIRMTMMMSQRQEQLLLPELKHMDCHLSYSL